MFSCEFCEISKNTFLRNTSGRLLVKENHKLMFLINDVELTSWEWTSFLYDVFQTTVFYRFQQRSTRIKTGMFHKIWNFLTFLSKLNALATDLPIDKLGKVMEISPSFVAAIFRSVQSMPLILC